MPNNPPGDRPPRKKGPRRAPSSDQQPRQPRPGDRPRPERQGSPGGHGGGPRMGGERQNSPRSGRMSREEIEWVRDLWQHKEPVDEIAQQLGAPQAEIEALIAGWENH